MGVTIQGAGAKRIANIAVRPVMDLGSTLKPKMSAFRVVRESYVRPARRGRSRTSSSLVPFCEREFLAEAVCNHERRGGCCRGGHRSFLLFARSPGLWRLLRQLRPPSRLS